MPDDNPNATPADMLAAYRQAATDGDPDKIATALAALAAVRNAVEALPDGASDAEIAEALAGVGRADLAKLKQPAPPTPLPTVCDAWEEPGRPTDWLAKPWLPACRVALLSGEGGRGKSKLALMLAAGVAGEPHNGEWLAGGPDLVRHGPVVFATWEDSRDDIRLRLCDWPAAKGNYRETLPRLLGDRLAVMDCARSGPAWAPTGSRHTSTMGELTATGAAIRAEAERREAVLLVLDPLAAAYACNENDRGLVRGFMADWDGWARAKGCTVLLIAHPPKSGAEYSGSTDWQAAPRAVWTLGMEDLPNAKETTATKLECIKSSHAKRPKPLKLDNWQWWRASEWPEEARSGGKRGMKPGIEGNIPSVQA